MSTLSSVPINKLVPVTPVGIYRPLSAAGDRRWSPYGRDLTADERDRVRDLQIWLQAVKRCPSCRIMMPVECFPESPTPEQTMCELCSAQHLSDAARTGHSTRHQQQTLRRPSVAYA